MQNRKCYILIKNEENKTIDEYNVLYNIKELNDYTKLLIDKNNNNLVIKTILESNFLGNYNNHKGILSIDKISYLTNYINRNSGKELFGNVNFNFDYDSFLPKEEKIKIVKEYLELLKFVLINSYDLTAIENAFDCFSKLKTPGTNEAYKGCQKILTISEKTSNLFKTVNFKIEK